MNLSSACHMLGSHLEEHALIVAVTNSAKNVNRKVSVADYSGMVPRIQARDNVIQIVVPSPKLLLLI